MIRVFTHLSDLSKHVYANVFEDLWSIDGSSIVCEDLWSIDGSSIVCDPVSEPALKGGALVQLSTSAALLTVFPLGQRRLVSKDCCQNQYIVTHLVPYRGAPPLRCH